MAEQHKFQNQQSPHTNSDHFSAMRQRLVEGDAFTWNDLNSKYRGKAISILSFIDPELAEDAWQETLHKLARDPSRIPEVMKGNDIWPWIKQVARRKIIDLFRKNRHHQETLTFEQSIHEGTHHMPSSAQNDMAGSRDVKHAIDELDEKYRTVIQRHYFNGETFQEIAQDLKISPETIRTWHARAKAKLKQTLIGGDND